MAKQCCRYCGLLSEGDYYYCMVKGVMSDKQIKRANTCPHYCYTNAGNIITGKQYAPHAPYRARQEKALEYHQIELEDDNG